MIFEEIPDSLIINWNQTGINYAQWTMVVEGSKREEIAGADDKRQITAVFGASLAGDFLPPQLVYTVGMSHVHLTIGVIWTQQYGTLRTSS